MLPNTPVSDAQRVLNCVQNTKALHMGTMPATRILIEVPANGARIIPPNAPKRHYAAASAPGYECCPKSYIGSLFRWFSCYGYYNHSVCSNTCQSHNHNLPSLNITAKQMASARRATMLIILLLLQLPMCLVSPRCRGSAAMVSSL